MLVAGLIVSVVILVVVYFEIKRLRLSARFKHIPSVRECPILGTTYFFNTFEMQYFDKYIAEMVLAPLCKIFIGPLMVLIVSDPAVLQEVLSSPAFLERPVFMRFFPYDMGLLSAKHIHWKPIRRAANPAFSNLTVQSLIPIMNKHFLRCVDELSTHLDGDAFDVNHVIMRIMLAEIMDTTFKYTNIHDKLDMEPFEKIVELGLDRARTPVMYPDIIWKFTKTKKEMDRMVEIVDSLLMPWVKEQWERSGDSTTFVDMLSKFSKKGERLEFKQIYDNVITLLLTGYETSALAMAYTILMLAMHPEIDAKLAAELQENVKPDDDELDQELLKRLPYLDMVMKETLRLFAVAPFIPREALYDVEIKGLGLVPKGTILGQVFFMLHRWKHIWGPDAAAYNPDHFLPEAVAQRHPMSFIPFGHGARSCIAANYSVVNIKLGLIHILRKYRFTTDLKLSDLTFKFMISLRLNQLHMVKVHLRETNSD